MDTSEHVRKAKNLLSGLDCRGPGTPDYGCRTSTQSLNLQMAGLSGQTCVQLGVLSVECEASTLSPKHWCPQKAPGGGEALLGVCKYSKCTVSPSTAWGRAGHVIDC